MNNTIQRVLELESNTTVPKGCEVVIKIKVPQKEMQDACNYLKCHLYHPFESLEQSVYWFRYKSESKKDLIIDVESIEQFRAKVDIIEI